MASAACVRRYALRARHLDLRRRSLDARALAAHQRSPQLGQVGVAFVALFLNQICFVYALKLTTATTVALILGTMPIFAGALRHRSTGLEHMARPVLARRRCLVRGRRLSWPLGSGGDVSGDLARDPPRARHRRRPGPRTRSRSHRSCGRTRRIASARVVLMRHVRPLVLVASPQLADQDFDLGWLVWLGFAFAVVGPLVLTNVLWFTAVHRVGPARASLFVEPPAVPRRAVRRRPALRAALRAGRSAAAP